jgi:hypothetical protein
MPHKMPPLTQASLQEPTLSSFTLRDGHTALSKRASPPIGAACKHCGVIMNVTQNRDLRADGLG